MLSLACPTPATASHLRRCPCLPAAQEAAAAGLLGKPLTAKNVEEMLGNLGLPAEFATHSQVCARTAPGWARGCGRRWQRTEQLPRPSPRPVPHPL